MESAAVESAPVEASTMVAAMVIAGAPIDAAVIAAPPAIAAAVIAGAIVGPASAIVAAIIRIASGVAVTGVDACRVTSGEPDGQRSQDRAQ
jgi:hypothetical protein